MLILLHRKFVKQFRKLPHKLQGRFRERRALFLANPAHPLLDNHALTGDRLGQWSINITGNWRAVYEFVGENSVVFVEIGTHPQLYG